MDEMNRAARLTGLAYLGIAVSAFVGTLWIRPQLYAAGDAVATAANLVAHEGLARVGIAADITMVLTQCLAALYFFKLFRGVSLFAAGSLAAFAFMNGVVGLVSVTFSAAALTEALGGAASAPANTLVLYRLTDAVWDAGQVFFGLWLIPMGWLVLRSGFASRVLGWLLIVGGVGYIISTYLDFLFAVGDTVATALIVPATIGEFWMIGHLLSKGVRSRSARVAVD